jgi:hypothetical protein
MNHHERRAKGRTTNSGKSLTDQSQADDTNINVILRKYGVTGVATGRAGQPQYLDHSELPRDLREAIDLTRRATSLRDSLPEALRSKPLEELNALTMEQLNTILHPPADPPATPPGDPK